MATLVLAGLGASVGGAIGGSVLGISAGLIGQAVGASLGSVVDQALMPGAGTTRREGQRLDSLQVMTSEAGAAIPDIWGRTAIAGQVIWAARLKEVASTTTQRVGSGKKKGKVKTTDYSYFASFAVSLSEGIIRGYGRIWADGRLLDVVTMEAEGRIRFYGGSEVQTPDPLIAAIEGDAPAFRGIAYLVFEDLPLEEFGNRLPQIKVEVYGKAGAMEDLVRGVCLIPGSTEWGYDTQVARIVEENDRGEWVTEFADNAHRHATRPDIFEALSHLDAALPAADAVSLVVAWFGTDLRAGACAIEPRVEYRDRSTDPVYEAGNYDRVSINEVSRTAGRPSYGSSPSDASVIRAIRHLKARGKRVVLYPFVMMDVQAAQGLPHPSGSGVQPDFPWRGRIEPAAGNPVATEIAAFLGSAAAADFSVTVGADAVGYTGPMDGGFRRFILHLAALAKAAGGVDAMLIGSEMRGLSFASDAPGSYPFVTGLQALAAEVRALLPAAQISYAADWSEYHSHRTGAEVFFHLDPLWSDANIDFVAVDNYLPLSDWRPGTDHADYDPLGVTSPHDLDYLKGNIEGGEYWDWYYADDAARAAQTRTPIADGAHGEHWVYRQKAIRDWHGNAHHNRPGGVRSASATGWVPGSKPVWFTEIGCPAVEFGTNQPNVFNARLSSESALPYFSGGARDDFIQRQYLRAMYEWWGANGGGVVSPADMQVWCWDARPFPEFPAASALWADGPDWRLGHWLNGRAGAAPVAELVAARAARHGLGLGDLDVSRAWGQADGYAIAGPMSWRDVLQPFEVALASSAVEDGGKVVVETRAAPRVAPGIGEDDLAEPEGGAGWTLTRAAIEDRAREAVLRFRDGLGDYVTAAARAVIGAGRESGVAQAESPLILDFERGSQATERMLREALASREVLSATLPRSMADIRPGMVVPVTLGGRIVPILVERMTDGEAIEIEGRLYDDAAFAGVSGATPRGRGLPTFGASSVILVPMDLPLLQVLPAVAEWDGYLAAHAVPWPGGVGVIRSASATGTGPSLVIGDLATMGELVAPLAPGRVWTWDEGGSAVVRLYRGSLVTRSRAEVAAGANVLAIEHAPGDWEIVQFSTALLTGGNEWTLSDLVRGARGTERLARGTAPAGARVVAIDLAVTEAGLAAADAGLSAWLRYGPAAADPVEYAAISHRFVGVGRRPYAPCRLEAADAGGDTVLAWVRRSRTGEGFSLSTAPTLGEASESYRVEFGPAGSPFRVATVAAPAFTWSAAMKAADGASGPVAVRVAQISATWGPGEAAEITVTP